MAVAGVGFSQPIRGANTDYRRIATLEEYVPIGQKTKRVDAFHKNEVGQWVLFSCRESDRREWSSIGFSGAIEPLL
jgi:hypothetical protein